ncbi:MAG TPA: hypothetical protein VJ183_10520 [Chloroflexia bacterium]|nr:hypothetical protein [Chloroflexia bacterium]
MFAYPARTRLFILMLIIFAACLISVRLFTIDGAGWSHPDFPIAFWSNFWSDLFIAIPIAGGLAWLASWRKVADAQIVAEMIGTGETMGGHPDGEIVRLTLFLENTGALAFRSEEIYWTVFARIQVPTPELPKGVEHLRFGGITRQPYFMPNNSSHTSWRGKTVETEEAIAGSITYLLFKVSGKLMTPLFHDLRLELFHWEDYRAVLRAVELHYYLSTPFGIIPSTFRFSESDVTPLHKLPMVKYSKRRYVSKIPIS